MTCGELVLEGGCGYGQGENSGHRLCSIRQVQGHHPHVLGLPCCRVPTLFSVTPDGSYNVPLAPGHPHVCENIKEHQWHCAHEWLYPLAGTKSTHQL